MPRKKREVKEATPKKLFLVWNPPENDNGGYFDQFDEFEDAVSARDNGTDVYEADIKYLGQFVTKMQIVKVKKRGRPAKTV